MAFGLEVTTHWPKAAVVICPSFPRRAALFFFFFLPFPFNNQVALISAIVGTDAVRIERRAAVVVVVRNWRIRFLDRSGICFLPLVNYPIEEGGG